MPKYPKRRPLLLATADWHLAPRAWANRPTLKSDSYFALEQIVSMAIDEQLPIVAAGDLIDRQVNEQAPIEFVREQLDKLQANKIPLWFIQGQHELQARPWLRVHKWPDWLEEGGAVQGGLEIRGFDWKPTAELATKLAEYQKEGFGLRFKAATEVLGNPMDIQTARRTVARLKTVQAERAAKAKAQ